MRWLLRKIDSLIGTILGVIGAIAASQAPAFVQQYLQRLGGHLGEAELNYERTIASAAGKSLDADTRDALAQALAARIDELREALNAIDGASVLLKPYALAVNADWDIVAGTLEAFQPQIPLDFAGIVYGGGGIVVAWILYDVVKIPFRARGGATERADP